MVQSFDHRSIATISELDPRIRTSALDGMPSRIVQSTKASIWSPRYPRVTAENVREAHELGLLVIPWTVDNPEAMENLIDLGVDGIITNVPDVLQEILRERGIPFAPR
jgi:glycerophosphoryl diester phosphodiesterase